MNTKAHEDMALMIEQARQQVDEERSNRKYARVVAATRDLRAAQAVVRRLEKRIQEIAADDRDVFA